jgi:hypothetical protein
MKSFNETQTNLTFTNDYETIKNQNDNRPAQIEYQSFCIVHFPNDSDVIRSIMTLYTLIISYIVPLVTIFFCYMRMIVKFMNKSTFFNKNSSNNSSRNTTITTTSFRRRSKDFKVATSIAYNINNDEPLIIQSQINNNNNNISTNVS